MLKLVFAACAAAVLYLLLERSGGSLGLLVMSVAGAYVSLLILYLLHEA